MIAVDIQIHGYLRGHQLLSSSVDLPRGDQSVIDRLSDVAGPLRPNERFKPYLSGYPLPSGDRYVLARTWQDLTVARAGCVRTVTLLIPASAWAQANSPGIARPICFPASGRGRIPQGIVLPERPTDCAGTGFSGKRVTRGALSGGDKASRSIWRAGARAHRNEAHYCGVGRLQAGVRFLNIRPLSASN